VSKNGAYAWCNNNNKLYVYWESVSERDQIFIVLKKYTNDIQKAIYILYIYRMEIIYNERENSVENESI